MDSPISEIASGDSRHETPRVNTQHRILQFLKKSLQREYTILGLLIFVLLGMHFALVWQVYHPFLLFQDPGKQQFFIGTPSEIFDEAHYLKDDRSILAGTGTTRPEHLSLGKLFILAGFKLFGDSPLGWRFFPIIMGAVGIIFFYLICRRLKMGKAAAYLAVFFLVFENQTFVQSGVAMLDVFLLPFMLIAVWLYLRKNYLLSGVFIGLAGLVKLTGLMIAPAILLHWIIVRRDGSWKFLGLVLLVPVSFLGLMPFSDYFVFGHLTNPISRLTDVLSLGSSLTFASAPQASMARPWEWLFPNLNNANWMRDVYLMAYWYIPHYLGTISPTVWLLITPVFCYLIYYTIGRNDAATFALSWFFGTFILWIPLSLVTNRVSFIYYFFPSTGAICIGLGLAFGKLFDIWKMTPSPVLPPDGFPTGISPADSTPASLAALPSTVNGVEKQSILAFPEVTPVTSSNQDTILPRREIPDYRISRKLRLTSLSVLAGYLLLHVVTFLILSPFTAWWKYPIPPSPTT